MRLTKWHPGFAFAYGMPLPHTNEKCHNENRKFYQAHGTNKKKIAYGLRKKRSTKIDYVFFKKKAKPEIDVAILKKSLLVVSLKYHARIQYMQTSMCVCASHSIQAEQSICLCLLSCQIECHWNKRYDKWHHTSTKPNCYNAEHVDDCTKPQRKRQ